MEGAQARELVERAPIGIYRTTREGRFLYANAAFARMLGYASAAEVLLLDIPTQVYYESADRERILEECRRRGELHGYDVRLRRKDGSPLWVRFDMRRVAGEAPESTEMEGFVHDISESKRTEEELRKLARAVTGRKEAEAALAKSELYHRSLIEHALDLIAVLAPDGTILFASPSVERLLGVRPEDAKGLRVFDLVHPEDAPRVKERIAGVLTRGTRFEHVEFRVRHSDGTWRLLSVIGKPLPPETGIEGLIINARDLSERQQLEAQLRQSQKMEAIGRLAGGIAHDFNNLLTAILGYTELLLQDVGPDDPKTAELNEILAAAQRAAALTRQLLTFSRKQVEQVEVVDVAAAIRGMEQMLRRVIGEDVVFRTVVPDDLGRVRADRSQIEQVILNLVVNARDAMPKGGTLCVEAANVTRAGVDGSVGDGSHDDSWVVLSIVDDGVGMSAETLRHIFEPFFTTKPKGKGTGLGLATVYSIVHQAGGFTEVASESGEGTTFRVFFPRTQESPLEAPRKSGVHRQPLARGTETILLVEDEALVRKLAAEVLRGRGYTVLAAASGPEAIALAEANAEAICLVVTDVVMPGMSGPEGGGRPATQGFGFPVLYMSGYAESDSGALLPEGAPLLQKPFSPDVLAHRVRAFLDAAAG